MSTEILGATPDPCLVCTALDRRPVRTPRAGYTCDHCLRRMREQLDDLPAFYALAAGELDTTGSAGGRGSEVTLGLNVSALDLRLAGGVLGVLGSWAKAFREDLGLADWVEVRTVDVRDRTGVTLVELVAFLQRHLARVCESHPAVDVFAAELHDVHRDARVAVRDMPRQAWTVSCPLDDEDGPDGRCGAPIRVSGNDFGGHVRCRRCGTGWDVTRLLHVVASDQASSIWLPAEDVALLYGVSARTLRDWARRGDVQRSHGRYDLASVKMHLLTTRRSSDLDSQDDHCHNSSG